ncbi:aspartate/glutamate racemase family protein [Plastoroseomonas arctica]|uniref:Asp/Glu racemase n=1 Tax=Plastoroseomonas arctica TaxID=1509237 RepID=A0AAF1KUE0_9PROT|nr:aspartate/glutamate racemase family protein [Plastoroseomonas arctica]MBR0656022.1 Asp/Glu racemase [Plastoroseomonas arctica]
MSQASRRILVINPNSSASCTAGIAASLARFAAPTLPRIEVLSLPGGPPAIITWRHWYAAAEPLCRMIETQDAAAYIIACVSDPGLEAARTATQRPVFGVLRSAIAAAVARAERFGIIGFTDQSKARQLRALQSMGLEARLTQSLPLNLDMETLTDPIAPRARIRELAKELAAGGAQAIILGCAGMAGHRAAAEDAAGVAVIEPCQAAAVQALLAVG